MASFSEEEYEQDAIDKVIEENNLQKTDLDNMAELEQSMESMGSSPAPPAASSSSPRGPSAGARLPPGAMPTTQSGALDSKASEFWFPECRNCSCCKGFKHGCGCTRGTPATECQDPGCKTAADTETAVVEPIKPRPKLKIVYKNDVSAPAPVGASDTVVPAPINIAPEKSAGGTGEDGKACTFFTSPQGCRFGTACRFKHVGEGRIASALPSPVSTYGDSPHASPMGDGSQQRCKFYTQGTCKNGSNCRFSHH